MKSSTCCNGSLIEQGRYKECACTVQASRAALGINWDAQDPMESRMVRFVAAVLLVAVLAATSDGWVPILLEWVL